MFKADKLMVLLEREEEAVVMKLVGELTTLASFDFNKYLEKVVPTLESDLVVDLSKCEFVSSSGISSFFYLYRMAKERNISVTLASPTMPVAKVFQTVNLDKLLKIER